MVCFCLQTELSKNPQLLFSPIFSAFTLRLYCQIITIGTDLHVLQTNFLITLVHSTNLIVLKLNVLKNEYSIEEEKLKFLLVPRFFWLKPFFAQSFSCPEGKFLASCSLNCAFCLQSKGFTGSISPSSGCIWELHIFRGKFQLCTIQFIKKCS